jgi:putative ABC transport system substrate-binding protein
MKRRQFLVRASALATWSSLAHGQPRGGKVPKVGYLWHAGSAEEEGPYFKALQEGFERLGYIDGRNIIFEHRFPNEMPERFKSMAAELVALNVDVLMGGNTSSPYLKDATTTIPIVFMFVADPVGSKLVDSLARPGGNATGLSNFGRDLAGKRLQILKETVPRLSRVALLVNPNERSARLYIDVFQAAGAELGLNITTFEVRSLDELEPAFETMAKTGMQAVLLAGGGLIFQGRAVIPKLAIARRLPLSAYSRETFEPGALMSYGADQQEMCRRSAVYVDKILKGAKPGDLPVEQPTKLEFLISVKTANALGLTIPPHVLSAATQVIQ